MRRKLVKRVEALGRKLLSIFGRRDNLRRKRCDDPVQWKRWYKMNHRRQMQLRALKQQCGIKLNPEGVSLPRWTVR
jgi:hypothetical protein